MDARHVAALSTGLCPSRSVLRVGDCLGNPVFIKCRLRRQLPATSMAAAGAGEQQVIPSEMAASSSARRSGNYPPSPCTPFLNSLQAPSEQSEEKYINKILTIKEKISRWLKLSSQTPSIEALEVVDYIQQLGLSYHFQEEIRAALDQVTNNISTVLVQKDLHTTALLFRLLRENGYNISQDIFSDFIDEEGSFTPSSGCGIKGVLSLYESSFYSYEGENILDNAHNFSHSRLCSFLESNQKSHWEDKIVHALEQPIHWRMPRLHAKWFIDMYSKDEDMHPELCELAKHDFTRVQWEHQRDLKKLSDWWSEIGLVKNMPFARDRLVELFIFAIGIQSEPQFGYFRVEITKVCILITVIDDLYDVYGTMEELELFTEALERWDVISAMELLPHYMKICFMALYNTINKVTYKTLNDKGVNVAQFLKQMWVNHCKAYLIEAKWNNENHIAKLSEYLEISRTSIGNSLLMAYVYVLLSKEIKEKEMLCLSRLELLHWSSIASRLIDDLGTTMNEKKRGDVAKAMECYMHHEGVSEESARIHICSILHATWKKMKKCMITNHDIPEFLVKAIINHTRSMQSVYLNCDGVGFPSKDYRNQVISLLVEKYPEV